MQLKLRTFFLLTVVAALVFSNSPIWAQDDPVPEAKPVAALPEEGSEEAVPKAVVSPGGERIIYIPFKDLSGTFEDHKSDIIMPYGQYQELLAAWKKRNEKPKAPAAVITAADYQVRIDGDLARISATLKMTVLGEPWVWIRVKFGEASISSVAGDQVLLRGVGNGEYELYFETRGEKTVQLELAVPVSQSPDGRQFAFNVPPVGVTTLDVTVPRKDQSIEITPKIVELSVDAAEAAGDVTRLRANVGATQELRVQWHPKTTLKPEMNLLSSVNNQTLVNLEDGLIHTDTWLHYEILRGSMEQCRIVVPENQRILDVTATARIKNWKSEVQDGNQIVTVDFLTPVEKPVTVEVHSEQQLAENGEFAVGGWTAGTVSRGIHALDVVRESGQLAIRYSGDYNVTIAQQQGVVRIEDGEVAPHLKGANKLAYKFYTPDFTLNLSAKPVEPRLMVGHQILLTFQDDELQVADDLQYLVERAGVFELKLKVPADLVIDDVQSPRMKEYNFNEQSRELTVTLAERTQGTIPLTIRAHRPLAADQGPQKLPFIEPLNVERETGVIFVYAKDAIEVVTEQTGLEGVQPLPANQARRGNTSLNSAWSFTRRPLTIPVRTQRKPTRLSAQVGTTIDIQPELTQVQTELEYLIEYSGVETFRFEVPEAISADLRIELPPGDQVSAPIKQRTAGEPVDGWVTWTVITQREMIGKQRFLMTYDVPQGTPDAATDDENEDAEDSDLLVQLVRPLELINDARESTTSLSNVQGEVLVKKERSLSISSKGTGGGIELIDLRELKTLPQAGTLAYRYFNASAEDRSTVKISQSRHEIQEVVSTVVSRGLVEIVAGEDAEATYRGRFNVKTTERQRLLVHLPVNLEVLGTFLNEREVKLEKAELLDSETLGPNWLPFWVNVARAESSDQSFLLTFQFLWRVNPPLGESSFGRGKMSLPLPIIGERAASVTQELKVVVWVPEKYALVGDPSDFEIQTTRRSDSVLFGEWADRRIDYLEDWVSQGNSLTGTASQFPTEGRVPFVYTNLGGAKLIKVEWWNHVLMSLIVSVAIALIGWVLLRTSWENKLGMFLIAAFAAALYGLSDSHALSQGMHAARYGIWLLVGLWLVHGVFGLWNASRVALATGGATSATVVLNSGSVVSEDSEELESNLPASAPDEEHESPESP